MKESVESEALGDAEHERTARCRLATVGNRVLVLETEADDHLAVRAGSSCRLRL